MDLLFAGFAFGCLFSLIVHEVFAWIGRKWPDA